MDLERLLGHQIGQRTHMTTGAISETAGRVRVLVQDREGRLRAETRSVASSARFPAASSQNTQSACSPACLMYSIRRPEGLRHEVFLPTRLPALGVASSPLTVHSNALGPSLVASSRSMCSRSRARRPIPTPLESATVGRIGDGDTLELRGGARVLVQIDAPELGERECYGREALRELERLLSPGERIELEADPRLDAVDRFGRLLRYVHVSDSNVNVELVRRGAATPYFRRGTRGRYADDLEAAVDAARKQRRGLWAACHVSWTPDEPVTTRPR